MKASDEQLLPLVPAVEEATKGYRPHLSTVLRWCTRGSRGVRLESVVLGGRRLTSVAAVRRYMEATTAAADCATVPSESPKQADRRAKRAAELLAARVGK